MNLRLIREPSLKHATLGALYLDGVWQCWTLEDELREVVGQPVSTWKVPGETAIPAGVYDLVLDQSARFKRVLPRLVGVSGFDGIRIHAGNVIDDTEGCILIGQERRAASVLRSVKALEALLPRLAAAPTLQITVENPPDYVGRA
jgi:hypothetical protein